MFTAQNDAYVNSGESPFLERRSSTHFPIKIPVKVKCHEANTSNLRVIKGETRDISEKGAGILTTHNIPTSAPLSIELDFSSVCPFFEIPFEIVWSDKNQKHETLQYGIAFRDQQQDKYDAIKKILERIQLDESGIKKENMVPRNRKSLNINEHVVVLQDWLTKQFKDQFPHLSSYSFEPGHVQRNVENFIGATQIPVGIGGPIKINGQYAQGNYYVPFATTEGTLVDTYHYGMMMITRSGGANVIVSDNRMDITPIFRFKDLTESQRFVSWVNEHFSEIKAEAEKMSIEKLRSMAMTYKEAITAKKDEVGKLASRLKDIPLTKMMSDEAKGLKADIDGLNKSVSALKERFEVYYKKLKEKGGDLSGLEI